MTNRLASGPRTAEFQRTGTGNRIRIGSGNGNGSGSRMGYLSGTGTDTFSLMSTITFRGVPDVL